MLFCLKLRPKLQKNAENTQEQLVEFVSAGVLSQYLQGYAA